MDKQDFSMRLIGKCPKTIGELKKLIDKIEDNTSFGFRGMPAFDLYEVIHDGVLHVVFQEPINEQKIEIEADKIKAQ